MSEKVKFFWESNKQTFVICLIFALLIANLAIAA